MRRLEARGHEDLEMVHWVFTCLLVLDTLPLSFMDGYFQGYVYSEQSWERDRKVLPLQQREGVLSAHYKEKMSLRSDLEQAAFHHCYKYLRKQVKKEIFI